MKKEIIKEKIKEWFEGEKSRDEIEKIIKIIDNNDYEFTDEGHLIIKKMKYGFGFDEILYNFKD